MFYEESKIVKLLLCQKCTKRYDEYDEPRILPCGKTLCTQCVQGLADEFACDLCSDAHSVPQKGFPINEIVLSLILEQPNEVYRSRESELLKTNLNQLEHLANDVKFDFDNRGDKVKDHCIELKRQVQLATEQKIQEINDFNKKFLKEVDQYEKECIQKLANNNNEVKPAVDSLMLEINKFLVDKRLYLSRFQISEEEIFTSNEKSNELKTHLEFYKMIVKCLTFNNKLLEFEANKNQLEEINLGYLHFRPLDINLMIKHKSDSITKFISASYDETIKIWDLNSRQCINTLQGHYYAVVCLQIISNDRIISGSNDRTIKIWDLQSGQCITTLRGHSGYVTCLQLMSTNDRVISGSSDKTIKIWDINSSQCVNTIQAHNDSVCCLELLSNEKLISGSYAEIKIWDLHSCTCIGAISAHSNWVRCLQSILNDRVISGGGDNTIKIWDIYTGECLNTLKGHSSVVTCLQLISNDRVISGSSDSSIKIWNIQTGECLKTLKGHTGCVWSIQLLDNDKVISCSHDRTIKIWNINSGQCVNTFLGHSKDVACIQLIGNE